MDVQLKSAPQKEKQVLLFSIDFLFFFSLSLFFYFLETLKDLAGGGEWTVERERRAMKEWIEGGWPMFLLLLVEELLFLFAARRKEPYRKTMCFWGEKKTTLAIAVTLGLEQNKSFIFYSWFPKGLITKQHNRENRVFYNNYPRVFIFCFPLYSVASSSSDPKWSKWSAKHLLECVPSIVLIVHSHTFRNNQTRRSLSMPRSIFYLCNVLR